MVTKHIIGCSCGSPDCPEAVFIPTDAECEEAAEERRQAWQAEPLTAEERESTDKAQEDVAKAFGWTE